LFISDLGERVSFRGLLLETAMSRSVYRLPADDRTNGWSALLGTRQPKAPLQGDVAVDWVIVGAGYAGWRQHASWHNSNLMLPSPWWMRAWWGECLGPQLGLRDRSAAQLGAIGRRRGGGPQRDPRQPLCRGCAGAGSD
jgi:hypothetical protein